MSKETSEPDQAPSEPSQPAPAKKGKPNAPQRYPKKQYRREMAQLQLELIKLQRWVSGSQLKLVVLLEGLGPAGKKGAANRLAEGLDRHVCKSIHIDPPTGKESQRWEFQRYVEHFPPKGKIAVFDGSWYHFPAVERALGHTSAEEFATLLSSAGQFEQLAASSGITLVKFWFAASDAEQEKRFHAHHAALHKGKKRAKPSAKKAAVRSEDEQPSNSLAAVRAAIFQVGESIGQPWRLIPADDKRVGRLTFIRTLLTQAQ